MQTLVYDVERGVAQITLNRPHAKNAIDAVMRQEFADVTATIQRDESVRAVIITGAEGAFCSGGDIRGMQDSTTQASRARMTGLHNWCEPLIRLEKPVIAAVDGVAYGAGLGLALAADIVLATPGARFCASFLRMGLIPDFAILYTLPRVVGRQRAKELVFSAREFSAEEALKMDMVVEIHAVERLMTRAREIAISMASASPVALSIAKRALNLSTDNDLSAMLEIEASGQSLARSSDYHRDAISRFKNKEAPLFQWPVNRT